MTCPRAAQHDAVDHVPLGGDDWAHFRKRLTFEQRQAIQVAELAADYDTKNSAQATYRMIEQSLYTAPAEWREGYTDADGSVREGQMKPTLAMVKWFLDQYETKIETVLLGPETRQKMAQATVAFYRAAADAFCVDGSWGDWPTTDGEISELVEQKALEHWYAWRKEINDRLKAAGVDSAKGNTTP